MTTLNTLQDVINYVNEKAGNWYYRNQNFNDYSELSKAASEYFEWADTDYRSKFGLGENEYYLAQIKTDEYFCNEVNTVVTVYYYEGHIDSGVVAENYFYGYIVRY